MHESHAIWNLSHRNVGHSAHSVQCPLYPQKQTLVERVGMSALCKNQTSKSQLPADRQGIVAAQTCIGKDPANVRFGSCGHSTNSDRCPLYPQKRTSANTTSRSSLCRK